MFIFWIDTGILCDTSLTISCSPSINWPVVSDNDTSFGLDGTSAANPMAPLVNPLTLEPAAIWPVAESFNIVNVWISYKCKSNSVDPPVYGEFDAPKE